MRHRRKVGSQLDTDSNRFSEIPEMFLLAELPQYPNVDPFNYETMKKVLVEKLESFAAAPFTIQRISELLSDPRKQYSRIDKFMRAVEKTILVVSTVPPGRHRSESENGDSLDSALNGDFSTEVNVDIDMDHEPGFSAETKATPPAEKEVASDTSAIETTAAKKSLSPVKEDEAGTSTAAEGQLEAEVPSKTQEASLEISAETPHIASSPTKVTESTQVKAVEASTPVSETTGEDAVIAPTIAPEAVKSVDEAHLNEPIRATGNEILVDTSVIPSEPTPLAALENIVAIQTESSTIETPVVEEPVPVIASSSDSPAKSSAEEVPQESPAVVEESEVEAKRPKLSDAPEIAEAIQESPITASEKATPVEASTVADAAEAHPTVIEQTPSIPAPEQTEEVAVPSLEEKIDEPLPEEAEIQVEMTPQVAEIAEAAPAEMETVPTVTENTMSLDEEDPPAIELEMTPIAKMDTDETEAAPMDFEDDAEPMDQ